MLAKIGNYFKVLGLALVGKARPLDGGPPVPIKPD